MFGHNKEEESDVDKIGVMYDKYRIMMYKEAFKILKDDGLAEDTVHQSFLKLMNNI